MKIKNLHDKKQNIIQFLNQLIANELNNTEKVDNPMIDCSLDFTTTIEDNPERTLCRKKIIINLRYKNDLYLD